MPRTKENL